jgi:hypothetical protein
MIDDKRDQDEDLGEEEQDDIEYSDDEEDEILCIEPERVQAFAKTKQQLSTFRNEISVISAKKPDSPINMFKLGLINGTLGKANFVLGEEFLPFPGFKTFDEANMPTASDVVLILSHYIDALDAFRHQYCVDGQWNVTGDEEIEENYDQ